MSKINTDSGTIYIGLPGEALQPLGEINESELICAIEEKDEMAIKSILTRKEQKATLTINLTKQQIDRFLQEIMNVTHFVLEILHGIGNKRVAYLAKHAKKRRTRKKNIRRAYRIVSDERSYRNEQK